MTDEEVKARAMDIYANFFDEVVTYPEVLKAIAVGVLKGAETKERRIEELEQQVEKMKCCENCKYNSYWVTNCTVIMD